MQALTVRVDDKLHELLRARAYEQRVTMGQLVRDALAKHLGLEAPDDEVRSSG